MAQHHHESHEGASLAGAAQTTMEQSGERFWRLPLEDEYREQIVSQIGDIKNTGGRYGGVGMLLDLVARLLLVHVVPPGWSEPA